MNPLLVVVAFCLQGDPSAIEWTIPGQFKKALKQAGDSQRLLILKGISFGIDEEGAACATKGEW